MIYLSGAITSRKAVYKDEFGIVAALARYAGIEVFNPAEQFGGREDLPHETYMRWDIDNLLRCDAIWMLPNWTSSKGAACEFHVAKSCGIPVYHVHILPARPFNRDCRMVVSNPHTKEYQEIAFRLPNVIGFTGYAGAGKDTAFQAFNGAFKRVAFADELRREVLEQYGANITCHKSHATHSLQEAVDAFGWERVKRESPDVRTLLQDHGSQQRAKDPAYWITAANIPAIAKESPVAVTDVRYQNEIDHLHSLGGFVIEIQRRNTAAINAHPSETEWNGEADAVVMNDANDDILRTRILIALIILATKNTRRYATQPE